MLICEHSHTMLLVGAACGTRYKLSCMLTTYILRQRLLDQLAQQRSRAPHCIALRSREWHDTLRHSTAQHSTAQDRWWRSEHAKIKHFIEATPPYLLPVCGRLSGQCVAWLGSSQVPAALQQGTIPSLKFIAKLFFSLQNRDYHRHDTPIHSAGCYYQP